jgi:hypothetical protein
MRGIPLASDGGRNPGAGKLENDVYKLLTGTIAFCTLAAVAGIFALKRSAPIDDLKRQAPATADVTRPVHAGPAREFLPESDTTGLLRESLTVDELLDEIDADAGDALTSADRERLAVELREVLGD